MKQNHYRENISCDKMIVLCDNILRGYLHYYVEYMLLYLPAVARMTLILVSSDNVQNKSGLVCGSVLKKEIWGVEYILTQNVRGFSFTDSVKSSLFMLKCDEATAWIKTFHYAITETGCLADYKSPWKHMVMQNP